MLWNGAALQAQHSKGTLDSEFGDVPVKLRWDRLSDTVAGILFLSESAVEAIKKMPGFEAV